MHPLTPDLSELSDAELQKKHSELTARLTQSYRSGNGQLIYQIQMLMDDYQQEINRRQQKLLNDMLGKSDKFSGIIDVK